MNAPAEAYEIAFDASDDIGEDLAMELIADLKREGAEAEIGERYTGHGAFPVTDIVLLIPVVTASLAGLSVVAAFLERVFQKGVVLDLTRKNPRITKSDGLPRGSLVILWRDGRQELRQGISGKQIGDLMKAALQQDADKGDKTEDTGT